MSLFLVVMYNATPEVISFVNTETASDSRLVFPGGMFTTAVHFNIPDNSRSSTHFNDHHMEVQHANGNPIFSFWGDDRDFFKLKYCLARVWWGWVGEVPGYQPHRNGADLGLVLVGGGGVYDLRACPVEHRV